MSDIEQPRSTSREVLTVIWQLLSLAMLCVWFSMFFDVWAVVDDLVKDSATFARRMEKASPFWKERTQPLMTFWITMGIFCSVARLLSPTTKRKSDKST